MNCLVSKCLAVTICAVAIIGGCGRAGNEVVQIRFVLKEQVDSEIVLLILEGEEDVSRITQPDQYIQQPGLFRPYLERKKASELYPARPTSVEWHLPPISRKGRLLAIVIPRNSALGVRVTEVPSNKLNPGVKNVVNIPPLMSLSMLSEHESGDEMSSFLRKKGVSIP